MKVKLINYTGQGMGYKYTPALLAFTKNTRLNMTAGGLEDWLEKSEEELMKELEYMSNTIPSSWEFVDYIFSIEAVTRAFTHQFVRTRTGSYAQQTMRVLNVDGFTYEVGPTVKADPVLDRAYHDCMEYLNNLYNCLIENGAEIEDARGVLPTNIHTNIVAKFNLRTLAEMAQKRSSPRTQGEYRKVLDAMIDSVLVVHPWAKMFMRNRKMEAAAKLDKFIQGVFDGLGAVHDEKMDLLKAVDILRG